MPVQDAAAVYKKIWHLARPYYMKGRPKDIKHIVWLMKNALVLCRKEGIDDTILLPLAILHDIGYSQLARSKFFRIDRTKKEHMVIGTRLAGRILRQVKYPSAKVKKIVGLIAVHDNWALGDNRVYKRSRILSVFNDLDFIWGVTPQGFALGRQALKLDKQGTLDYFAKNDKMKKRPWATRTTKWMFKKYLTQRKK